MVTVWHIHVCIYIYLAIVICMFSVVKKHPPKNTVLITILQVLTTILEKVLDLRDPKNLRSHFISASATGRAPNHSWPPSLQVGLL